MTKKKPVPLYKHWWFPILSAIVIIPAGGGLVAMISQALAAPQEIKTVKDAVIQQAQISTDLKDMAVRNEKKDAEQDAELQKQKEISQLQIESLKAIVLEVKKK